MTFGLALVRVIAAVGILAMAFGTPTGTAKAQSPSATAAAKACKAKCQALKQAWRTAAETAKAQRTEIEQLRRDLTDLDAEWSRLARSSNRQTVAITKLKKLGDELLAKMRTEKSNKSGLSRSSDSAQHELKKLKDLFDQTRDRLSEIDKKRDAKKRQRVDLLKRYITSSAREKDAKAALDRLLKPGTSPQRAGVYASFNGSFDQCTTYDRVIMAHNLDIPVRELNAFLDRKDKSSTAINPKLAKRLKPARGQTSDSKDYPCPDLGNGHALNALKVCQLMASLVAPQHKNSVRPKRWDDGSGKLFCEQYRGSGGFGVTPAGVCQIYAKTKFGLTTADTTTLARWKASTYEAVCFYFKKARVASLMRDYRVSNEEKRLREIQKQIAKLKKYIAGEKAFAKAIENGFKNSVDPAGVDATIEKQVDLMGRASVAIAELKPYYDYLDRIIGLWEGAKVKIRKIPFDNANAGSVAASRIVHWVAQAEFNLVLPNIAAAAKYGTPVAIAFSVIAMPIEKAWKESIRDEAIEKVNARIRKIEKHRPKLDRLVRGHNHVFYASLAKRDKYIAVRNKRDRHEINADIAELRLKKLTRERDNLKSQIALKEKSGK
jgi:septal ring factor EnvC (AmiA/AmiB activator)